MTTILELVNKIREESSSKTYGDIVKASKLYDYLYRYTELLSDMDDTKNLIFDFSKLVYTTQVKKVYLLDIEKTRSLENFRKIKHADFLVSFQVEFEEEFEKITGKSVEEALKAK